MKKNKFTKQQEAEIKAAVETLHKVVEEVGGAQIDITWDKGDDHELEVMITDSFSNILAHEEGVRGDDMGRMVLTALKYADADKNR